MSSNNSDSAFSILSFVDGLWESAKVAKIVYFTLCFDLLFFILKGYGLFGIKLGKEFDLSLADLAGMIISIGIFSSILLKTVSRILFSILIEIKYSRAFRTKSDKPYQRSSTKVFMYELRDDALENGDDLSFNIYNKEFEQWVNKEKEHLKNEFISVGILLAFISEWYFSAFDGSSKLFIDWLWEQLKLRDPTISHGSVGMIVLITFLMYTLNICWPTDHEHKIYYPKLAKKLRKAEDERKKRFDQI